MTSRADIYERIIPIFRDYFEDDTMVVADDTVAAEVEGWDSMAHISLVVAIEKEFGIHLGVKHSTRLKNVGELVDAIAARI